VAKTLRMHVAGRTDVGLIREHNEDNLTVIDLERRAAETLQGPRELDVGARGALLIVCDGMGGAAAGEVASAMAIEAFSGYLLARTGTASEAQVQAGSVDERVRFARWMREAAFDANRRIFDSSRADSSRAGMGTTMTTVGVIGGDLVMTQVGDSRAYLLRRGVFTQVTRDQSLVNQLIETGQITEEQARLFEHSNVILQALGVQEEVEVLLSTVPLRRGDRLVVCTDGLTGVVADEEVASILASTRDVDEVCRLLVELARAGGGPDNITVIAARFDDESLPEPEPADKVVYERWRLDESEVTPTGDAPPSRPAPAPPRRRSRRTDPARTFFSLMLLMALSLGGLVMAAQMRRGGGAACTIVGAPGLAIRIDGRDIGVRTQGPSGVSLRLPHGQHRVALRQPGGSDTVRTIEISQAGDCRVTFEEER
jgi:protein phosphatase